MIYEPKDFDAKEYIKEQLEIQLEAYFSMLPWWCLLCGEGGNYKGERPAQYWFPPKSHICPDLTPDLFGVKGD